MSSDVAISVRGLSKEYVIGERSIGFTTLREQLTLGAQRLVRREREVPPRWERILALDDVSFDVERGQALGVIGHNGAGKTTLLKILSRITAPTKGEVRITGQVGSLLEVGTGFHPELTGRDNLFLNGAILGMRHREIRRKFDEIVAFAEVERFIDTPVKRYSSGMYVRLAFAVAAHLEPDILIVDEVLAVGDASFQRKCLGKMDEVSQEGRTVVFVSHNMASIRTLTPRCLWFDHGRIVGAGPSAQVISDYLAASAPDDGGLVADLSDDTLRRRVGKRTAQRVRFSSVAMVDSHGEPIGHVPGGGPLRVEVRFQARERVRFLELYVRVTTPDGMRLFSAFSGQLDEYVEPGRYRAVCEFPDPRLSPGRYEIELVARGADLEDIVPKALAFEVRAGYTEEENLRYATSWSGVVRVDSRWGELEQLGAGDSLTRTAQSGR